MERASAATFPGERLPNLATDAGDQRDVIGPRHDGGRGAFVLGQQMPQQVVASRRQLDQPLEKPILAVGVIGFAPVAGSGPGPS